MKIGFENVYSALSITSAIHFLKELKNQQK